MSTTEKTIPQPTRAEAAGCWWGAAALVSLPVTTLWRAWVFCRLWSWFVVPVFTAYELSLPNALGFFLLFGLLRRFKRIGEQTPEERLADMKWQLGTECLMPLGALGLGALYHWWAGL